jgi:hypothetical protein
VVNISIILSCDWDNFFWVLLGDFIEDNSSILNKFGLNCGVIIFSFFSSDSLFSSLFLWFLLVDILDKLSDISDKSYSFISIVSFSFSPSFSFSSELL